MGDTPLAVFRNEVHFAGLQIEVTPTNPKDAVRKEDLDAALAEVSVPRLVTLEFEVVDAEEHAYSMAHNFDLEDAANVALLSAKWRPDDESELEEAWGLAVQGVSADVAEIVFPSEAALSAGMLFQVVLKALEGAREAEETEEE